jgi:1,4-dihydroxy-2-naphthoate octaprenyltransferase
LDSTSTKETELHIWLLAARPKTLWAAITPVIMGGALALEADKLHWLALTAALAGAVLIQIGTNFANDLFDFLKETDTEDRIGPVRVTQAGLVSPGQMKAATTLVFVLAVLVGLYLVLRGGWPILVIGVLSILFAILYTAGPYPLGYTGLGDVFVLIFFGPVAVGGTYYVSSLELTTTSILAGVSAGMISTAILTVNNLRDYDTDKEAGKKTLAVRFGRGFARTEYLFMMIGGMLFPILIFLREPGHPWILISSLTVFMAITSIRRVMQTTGPELNEVLAQTGKMLALFGALFSVGWNL